MRSAAPLREQLGDAALDLGRRREEGGGVEVPLQGLAGPHPPPHLRERLPPVDGQHLDRQLGEGGEEVGAAVEVVDERHAPAQAVEDGEDGRQRDLPPAREVEQAPPGVEELDRLGAGRDLRAQVGERGAGEALEEAAQAFGVGPAPAEEVRELLRGAPFDQVGGERPGGAAEADHRHAAVERAPYQPQRLEDVAKGLLDLRLAQALDGLASAHRLRENRAVAGGEDQLRAHRLERQQDVGEEDCRVHAEDVHRLHCDLGRQLRRLAQGQEVRPRPHRAVLRQVAPGLAHDPDRRPLGRLAAAGAEEEGSIAGRITAPKNARDVARALRVYGT